MYLVFLHGRNSTGLWAWDALVHASEHCKSTQQDLHAMEYVTIASHRPAEPKALALARHDCVVV
jgi:hypothetical protein